MAADAAVFYTPTTGRTARAISVVAVVNDTNLSAAGGDNGRDQALAFGANSWVHFYLVLDGATVKSRSSATAPPTGPTLQGTESAWAYCGAIRYNGSSILVRTRMRGAWMLYDQYQFALANGAATTETAIDLASFIPPNASKVQIYSDLRVSTGLNGIGFPYTLIRAVSGSDNALAITLAKAVLTDIAIGSVTGILANTAQTLYYLIVEVGDGSDTTTLNVNIMGYVVPNGDA